MRYMQCSICTGVHSYSMSTPSTSIGWIPTSLSTSTQTGIWLACRHVQLVACSLNGNNGSIWNKMIRHLPHITTYCSTPVEVSCSGQLQLIMYSRAGQFHTWTYSIYAPLADRGNLRTQLNITLNLIKLHNVTYSPNQKRNAGEYVWNAICILDTLRLFCKVLEI